MLMGSRHGPEPYDRSMRPPSHPKAAYSEIGDKARHNVRYGDPNRKCLRRQQTSVRRPLRSVSCHEPTFSEGCSTSAVANSGH
jgi:hypothetical protein